MQSESQVADIARVIQLSVAPVFLLMAVCSLMGVLAGRLARIIDRARVLEELLHDATDERPTHLHDDLSTLSRRARLTNLGMTLSVAAALFVGAVIITLFASSIFHVDLTLEVSGLFIAGLVMLLGALLAFLREIRTASLALRIGPH